MPVALVWQQLEAGERNTLSFFPDPIRDFNQRLGLSWKRLALVGREQPIVISLRFEILAFLRWDA